MQLVRYRLRSVPTLLAMVFMVLVGCSKPPEVMGIDNPADPAASVPDVSRHRIFIVTTRVRSDEPGVFLSADRASDLGIAAVDVTIPPTHVTGELERPKRLPPNPRTEFTVTNPVVFASDAALISSINRELAARPAGERKLLLFVHGYNNTASDATLRLAQFVEDTEFKGVPILFTWASAAKTSRYVYDLNSALIARSKVKEVAEIMGKTNAESADVFAHSMGNILTMEGLLDLQLAGTLGTRGSINHIMLAAPDIDLDLFRTQIAQLAPAFREKIYILVSKDDRALRVSSRLAGGVPRVGAANAEELEKLGVTVIDLSEIDDSSSGSHSKYAGSPEVVRLVGAGLNSVSRFDQDETPAIEQILSVSPIRILSN